MQKRKTKTNTNRSRDPNRYRRRCPDPNARIQKFIHYTAIATFANADCHRNLHINSATSPGWMTNLCYSLVLATMMSVICGFVGLFFGIILSVPPRFIGYHCTEQQQYIELACHTWTHFDPSDKNLGGGGSDP